MARTFSQNGGNSSHIKVTLSKPEGSRKKGRPKLRWLDSVIKDVKSLQVEIC
jgi:hypothetical protein